MKEEDITKLPKWAQEKIRVLEGQLENSKDWYEKQLVQLGTANTKTFFGGYENFTGIPDDSKIKFNFGDHWDDCIEIKRTEENNTIEIYTPRLEGVTVYPKSTNLIHIKIKE